MKKEKLLLRLSTALVLISAFSILSVSLLAFYNPQAVMDLVATKLPNNDAASSIRGVFGGVGLTIVVCLLYSFRQNVQQSLGLLSIFWSLYALSRIITIYAEGKLGGFGTQWLIIETCFSVMAVALWVLVRKTRTNAVSAA